MKNDHVLYRIVDKETNQILFQSPSFLRAILYIDKYKPDNYSYYKVFYHGDEQFVAIDLEPDRFTLGLN